ncbi:MAG: alpha-glucan family phosphorylase, partial [Candidatus Limnocylindrales bacterium]
MSLIEIPTVRPAPFRLPQPLQGLTRLAYNFYWTWHPGVRDLFVRIDPIAWQRHHNPIPILQIHRDWSSLLDDVEFMVGYQTALERFDDYMADGHGTWFRRNHADALTGPVAYFCAEFGLHQSLGIYSGGLGVLAGDHCKTASDMALPFVAVGLFYRRGYFRQTIDADGHQEHAYPDLDPDRLPLMRVADEDGDALTVEVELPGRTVQVGVWLAQVGRVPLLLLDTDVPENRPEDRPITQILYVRGREMRLHQELVLGMGGLRALRALEIAPCAWHLNEGHSAFMLVEQMREFTAAGMDLDDAMARVKSGSVFTIHTPVQAGNERFDADLVRRIAAPETTDHGLDLERILTLGRGTDDDTTQFDMTAFTLRLTSGASAVSKLHAETANATWESIISRPILAITNGVHAPSWLGAPFRELYAWLGADLDRIDGERKKDRFWERLDKIPDDQLWEAHLRQKQGLAQFARARLRMQFARHGESPDSLEKLETALDPDVLTIGFARRFATYKRANLVMRDAEMLASMINAADQPIQLVFAGKAHP